MGGDPASRWDAPGLGILMVSVKKSAYMKKWIASNGDKIRACRRKYWHSNKAFRDRCAILSKKWLAENRQHWYATVKNYLIRVRKQVIDSYGGECVCCKEKNYGFLTIEHLKHDAKNDRKGQKLYAWLLKNGCPKDRYTILCMNCNWATRNGKICPHKQINT